MLKQDAISLSAGRYSASPGCEVKLWSATGGPVLDQSIAVRRPRSRFSQSAWVDRILTGVLLAFLFGASTATSLAQTAPATNMEAPAAALRPEWKPVNQAPAGFPVPLYTGSQTQFLQMPGNNVAAGNKGGRIAYQILLKTQDNPDTVVQWYRLALKQKGFQENQGQVRMPEGVKQRLIRAQSSTLSASIVVGEGVSQTGGGTVIQVFAMERKRK